MKKTVIVGGGIAGLTAGVYAQLNGFKSEIYEKNPVAGGLIASQWLQSPGGLPVAAATGKFVIQRILKKEGKSINI